MAVEQGAGVEEGFELVVKANNTILELLVGLGLEGLAEVGLDVVVEGQPVDNSEQPVEGTAHFGGTGGKLLDLDRVLASYVLVGELNDKVVRILSKELSLGADRAKIERDDISDKIVSLSYNGVEEFVRLAGLSVTGGVGVGRVSLGSKGVTEQSLPWLIVCDSL